MVKAILWDVDGTLLDFLAAEKAAVQRLFREFGLGECTDEMVARYSAINESYWKRLERGEITKQQVLIGRYREFFAEVGVDPSLAEPFNARYQHALGDTVVYRDDSLNVNVKRLTCVEQSGLNIHRLSFLLTANNRGASLQQFQLQLPSTEIRMDSVTATYDS